MIIVSFKISTKTLAILGSQLKTRNNPLSQQLHPERSWKLHALIPCLTSNIKIFKNNQLDNTIENQHLQKTTLHDGKSCFCERVVCFRCDISSQRMSLAFYYTSWAPIIALQSPIICMFSKKNAHSLRHVMIEEKIVEVHNLVSDVSTVSNVSQVLPQ